MNSESKSLTVTAQISFGAAVLFLVLLGVLRILKPELDPSWRMISEYEIGPWGWVMQCAFGSLAVSCVALVVVLRSYVRTKGGRIGLVFLMLSAFGLAIAAFGVADPITATKDQLTTHGNMHGVGAAIGIPSLTIAAVLISLSLQRSAEWLPIRRPLVWAAHATWICVLLMILTIAILLPRNGGQFGPNVFVGWPNRLLVVAYCVWLMIAAWHVIKLNQPDAEVVIE